MGSGLLSARCWHRTPARRSSCSACAYGMGASSWPRSVPAGRRGTLHSETPPQASISCARSNRPPAPGSAWVCSVTRCSSRARAARSRRLDRTWLGRWRRATIRLRASPGSPRKRRCPARSPAPWAARGAPTAASSARRSSAPERSAVARRTTPTPRRCSASGTPRWAASSRCCGARARRGSWSCPTRRGSRHAWS
jgi:hypothetical protein